MKIYVVSEKLSGQGLKVLSAHLTYEAAKAKVREPKPLTTTPMVQVDANLNKVIFRRGDGYEYRYIDTFEVEAESLQTALSEAETDLAIEIIDASGYTGLKSVAALKTKLEEFRRAYS